MYINLVYIHIVYIVIYICEKLCKGFDVDFERENFSIYQRGKYFCYRTWFGPISHYLPTIAIWY